jgi:hypothetical protein
MYQWLIFLHVGSVLVFMLLHGVQVVVTWKKRWETDPARNMALFEALPSSMPLRISLAAVVVSGIALVALLDIWTRVWVWASLVLLAVIWLAMWRWGAGYYDAMAQTSEAAIAAAGTADEPTARAGFDRARLSQSVPAMTVVGIGGTAVILWLMVFKPF